MCNISEGIARRYRDIGLAEGRAEGEAKGLENGTLLSIRNLMDTMKWSLDQAMNALKIPENERGKYSAMLK